MIALVYTTAYFGLPISASAAALSAVSDTMSEQNASANSSHTIKFTVAGAINTSGQKIIIAFPSDFDFTSFVVGDVTFTHGATTGAETNESAANLQDGAPSATHWGFAVSGTQNRTMTLTAPTDGIGAAALAASDKVIITYSSTHAVNATTSGSKTISITTTTNDGSTPLDTGSIAVPIVGGSAADDSVSISATVDPTITFTNDDAAIGFGTLSSSAARYATADTTGSGSDSVAHTMTVATNAASGYTLAYTGASLTKGGDVIDVATITGDANGTPGSEQFAVAGALTGSGSMISDYDSASSNWKFVAATPSTLASSTGPVASDSIAMHYLANISGSTPAGTYTTIVTFTATGNF